MGSSSGDEIDRAIAELRRQVEAADRDPRAARVRGHLDQMGAELRDMDEERWEAAVESVMESTGMGEDEVRNWFGRLSGKCDPGDATWTGKGGAK